MIVDKVRAVVTVNMIDRSRFRALVRYAPSSPGNLDLALEELELDQLETVLYLSQTD